MACVVFASAMKPSMHDYIERSRDFPGKMDEVWHMKLKKKLRSNRNVITVQIIFQERS
jgi:hypothetical protein